MRMRFAGWFTGAFTGPTLLKPKRKVKVGIQKQGQSKPDLIPGQGENPVPQDQLAAPAPHAYREYLSTEVEQLRRELNEANRRLQASQAQLAQSEKLAVVGQLTASIVHDLKNPLTVISGVSEILRTDKGIAPDLQQELAIIHESALKAMNLVADLLRFARRSSSQVYRQDLRETVEASLRLTSYLAREAQIQVEKNLPENPVFATYSSQQIEQVLINLITNAIQAMGNTGLLRVTLEIKNEAARIIVQDSGCGIAPQNLSRIFEPFFTTKHEAEGTGLGLSVSREIISTHHGQIEVESAPEKGSAFIVTLPLINYPPTESDH